MEKWMEYYTDEQLKKIQELEFKNFLVFDEVCKKIGVNWFVYGGTMIGAVRHKGFVPWDDDFDVAMPRADYEKFVKEAPAVLPQEYHLQTPYTDKKTPYSFSKLRLKGTTYIEYVYHKLDIEKGVYIDIYPIDNLPDSDEDFYRQYKAFHRLAVLYAWKQSPYIDKKCNKISYLVKQTMKFVVWVLLKLVPQKCIIKKMDKISKRYNNTKTSRMGNLYYPKPVNVFTEIFPLVDGEFEGQPVKLPKCWDQHLKSRYGNYMEMPPPEKRIGHKPYILEFGNY